MVFQVIILTFKIKSVHDIMGIGLREMDISAIDTVTHRGVQLMSVAFFILKFRYLGVRFKA